MIDGISSCRRNEMLNYYGLLKSFRSFIKSDLAKKAE